MDAFLYPPQPHVRRHGPQGYADLDSFRPWLRDEFSFRCVYCLLREQWASFRGVLGIDHFLAAVLDPESTLLYDNLLYCCMTCNSAKREERVANPEHALTAETVRVHEDGTIEGRTRDARRIIRVLGLDDHEHKEWRMLWLGIIAIVKRYDPTLFQKLMGYPADVPDLARLRPPDGNSRPEGVAKSHWAQRNQGTLEPTY
jgi:hypothetical protein